MSTRPDHPTSDRSPRMRLLTRTVTAASAVAVAAATVLVVTPARADSEPTLLAPGASNLRLTNLQGGSGNVPRWVDITSGTVNVQTTFRLTADLAGKNPSLATATVGTAAQPALAMAWAAAVSTPVGDWTASLPLDPATLNSGLHQIGMGSAFSASLQFTAPPLTAPVYVVDGSTQLEQLTSDQWNVPADGLEVNKTFTPTRLPVAMPTGSGTTVTYQWFGPSGAVSSATTSTAAFTPPTDLYGRSVTLRVTAARAGYASTVVTSPPFPVTGLRVTPQAPVERPGGRFLVTATPGVEYLRDGTPLSAGEHDGAGRRVVVTARALNGFSIPAAAAKEWTFDFRRVVDVPAPTWDKAAGTLTVPDAAPVEYLLDGQVLAPGTRTLRGLLQLTARITDPTARVADGSVLAWTADTRRAVQPVPATFDLDQMTYTIPDQPGVVWKVGGAVVAPGTHTAGHGTVTAVPSAADGTVELTSTPTMVAPFVLTPVPVPAVVLDAASRTLTVPARQGVRYLLDGEPVSEGRYPLGTVRVDVTAVPALPRFQLTGTTVWSADWRIAVTPPAPQRNPATGAVVVPRITGLEYLLDGEVVAGGTEVFGTATSVVSARPADRFHRLTPGVTAQWTFDARPAAGVGAPTWDTDAMTYTLPAVPHARWWVRNPGGTLVAMDPGTHPVPWTGTNVTSIEVSLDAVAGYAGTPQVWSQPFTWSSVTPTAPSARVTADGGEVLVPDVTGVRYRLDGAPVAAGTVQVSGLVTLTAHPAQARYRLTGTTTWTLDNRRTATPLAPVLDADRLRVTVPDVPGVRYLRGTSVLAAGSHSFGGHLELRAVAAGPGWKLAEGATDAWTFVAPVTTLTAPAPTLLDGVLTVPAQPDVRYLLDGAPTTAGEHPVRGWVTVTAESTAPRVRLEGRTSWDMDARVLVRPLAPTFDRATGRLTVPVVEGVRYRIGGTVVTGTRTVTGTVRVTAEPAGIDVAVADDTVSEWTLTRAGLVAAATRKPSFDKRRGVLTVPRVTGLQYLVGGKVVQPGTKVKVRKGRKVVVTVRATSGYRATGTLRWTFKRPR